MRTMLYIDQQDCEKKLLANFRLDSHSWQDAPKGQIRIARFQNIFWPELQQGYYGDIYMKRFIRKWKRVTMERKEGRHLAETYLGKKLCHDVVSSIIEFL
jgi:hypothetical protein